jgi:hypothetical protein
LIHHEPDIALLPMAWGPRFGLNLQSIPLLDLVVEILFCVACWKFFGGSRALLIGIVIFNLLNIPLMFQRPGIGTLVAQHHNLLPTLILIQVLASWLLIWWFGHTTVFSEQPPVPLAG